MPSCSPLERALLELRWRKLEHPNAGLVKQVCDGRWSEALESNRDLFSVDDSSLKVELVSSPDPVKRLACAVALLCAYVQISFTGPDFGLDPATLLGLSEEQALNSSSLGQLALAGEPAYHLANGATYLLLALKLLELPLLQDDVSASSFGEDLPTVAWWRLRARVLQHRLLDERIPFSPSLLTAAKELAPLFSESSPTTTKEDASSDADLGSMLTLELGLAESLVGNDRDANQLFLRAVREAGLQYELTGVLGKKTKFQKNDISQLVVLAAGRQRHPPVSGRSKDSATAATEAMPTTLPLNDDTLLERTKFTATSSASSPALAALDPEKQPLLHPLDQSLLLALCLSINNTSPSHGLTAVQIAPFVTRVLENASNWSVHSMALLLRSRLEASRTRTVERGLLQHQALVDQLAKENAAEQANGLERVQWTWGIDLPARWELERELAWKLQAMGVLRSAMEIFERLEMWEDVVGCYSSLGRKDQGAEVVKELLSGRKQETGVAMGKVARDGRREAKLWCLLGDLESDPAHWERAWSVSSGSSSRAMRSLGAYHFSRADYAKSQECLERALKINPLFVRSWFVLGCAAMQTEDWETAEHAFGRCVAIEEDDAEGWSNLASVHLRRPDLTTEANGHGEEQADEDEALKASRSGVKLPFSRRKAAFYCLKRAAQLSYDSWKIWTNYMVVAIDVGELAEAARALGRVVERRGKQGLDLHVLQRLVSAAAVDQDEEGRANPNEGRALRNRLKDLFDRILLVKCASSPRVFLLHAKLLSASPSPSDADLDTALEAYLAANRVGVAQNDAVETSPAAFRDASEIVQACVDALQSLGPRERRSGGLVRKDWKWQARSLVRGFLARTKGAFEEDEGWQTLQAEVAGLK